jgi:cytosine/adenosine deaminase-related metal-dependent hydrolase
MSLILKNANLFKNKFNEIWVGNVLIDKNSNKKVIYSKEISELLDKSSEATIIDCNRLLVMPAYINAHFHSQNFFSQLILTDETILGLQKQEKIYHKLDKIWDRDLLEAAALYSAINLLKNGTIHVIDMLSGPAIASIDNIQIIYETYKKVGVNVMPVIVITDKYGFGVAENLLDTTEAWLKSHKGLMGLDHLFNVGTGTLTEVKRLMDKFKCGIHGHLAEYAYDQSHSIDKYKLSVVERLDALNLINNPRSMWAGCLHITNDEVDLIRENKNNVIELYESSQWENKGYFSSEGLPLIMFGTDGMHSDMWQTMKNTYYFNTEYDRISINDALKRLYQPHKYFSRFFPSIYDPASFVIYDCPLINCINEEMKPMQLLQLIDRKYIKYVISQGEITVEDNKLTKIKELDAYILINRQFKRLKSLYNNRQY